MVFRPDHIFSRDEATPPEALSVGPSAGPPVMLSLFGLLVVVVVAFQVELFLVGLRPVPLHNERLCVHTFGESHRTDVNSMSVQVMSWCCLVLSGPTLPTLPLSE